MSDRGYGEHGPEGDEQQGFAYLKALANPDNPKADMDLTREYTGVWKLLIYAALICVGVGTYLAVRVGADVSGKIVNGKNSIEGPVGFVLIGLGAVLLIVAALKYRIEFTKGTATRVPKAAATDPAKPKGKPKGKAPKE